MSSCLHPTNTGDGDLMLFALTTTHIVITSNVANTCVGDIITVTTSGRNIEPTHDLLPNVAVTSAWIVLEHGVLNYVCKLMRHRLVDHGVNIFHEQHFIEADEWFSETNTTTASRSATKVIVQLGNHTLSSLLEHDVAALIDLVLNPLMNLNVHVEETISEF